jgi:hypothetical protein
LTEKFAGYFRLVEACGHPGCPVCRCVVAESRQYLKMFLHEGVTDPVSRRSVRASWGFCNWHTWMLLEIENAPFGAAIVYEDLVRLALRRSERLGRTSRRRRAGRWHAALRGRLQRPTAVEQYRRRALCPACASAAETEQGYLRTMVAFVDDPELSTPYAASDGLCFPHMVRAAEEEPDAPQLDTLLARTRDRWAEIGRDIAAFVGKHDYRNREPFTAAEAASYTRAFEMLAGARSFFGSDVHTWSTARAPRRGARRRDAR